MADPLGGEVHRCNPVAIAAVGATYPALGSSQGPPREHVNSSANFLPVQQPNGDRCMLLLRDSIPLEDANGRISFETNP